MKSNDLEAVSKSVASMIEEWVDGGLKMGTDWRPGLASVIERRLARFADKPAPTIVDLANADADGYRNGRASVVADLGAAFDAGWDASGEGWNGEYPSDAKRNQQWKEGKDEAIAAIIAAGGTVKD